MININKLINNSDTSESKNYGYRPVEIKITKVQQIDMESPAIDHPLIVRAIEADDYRDRIYIRLSVVDPATGEKRNTDIVTPLTTKAGKYAFYPGFYGKDGKYVATTMLYEIYRALRQLPQNRDTEGETSKNPLEWEGKTFNLKAKFLDNSVILLTDYQRVKDEEYEKKQLDDASRVNPTEGYPWDEEEKKQEPKVPF